MQQLVLVGLGLVASVVATSQLPAQQAPQDPQRVEVQRVIAEFAERVQANDLEAVGAFFPPRGHILTNDATTHSWTEYRDQYLVPELSRFPGLRYAHTRIEPVVRGDVAWVAFRRELSSSASGVAPVEGRGTAVLECRDGRWLIVHLHMSE